MSNTWKTVLIALVILAIIGGGVSLLTHFKRKGGNINSGIRIITETEMISYMAGTKVKYYDPEDIVASDGTTLASLDDSGPNSFDLVERTTGKGAVYRATGGPNSKACIEFNGSDQGMLYNTDTDWTADGKEFFLIMAVKSAAAQSFYANWFSYGYEGSSQPGPVMESSIETQNNPYTIYPDTSSGYGNSELITTNFPDNTWQIFHAYKSGGAGGTIKHFVNGVQTAEGSLTVERRGGSSKFSLGYSFQFVATNGRFLNGSFGRIIISPDRKWTDTQITDTVRYFGNFYNISVP